MANREKGNWPPYNVKAIEQNIRLVMRTGDISKLNGKTYHIIYQLMGFIAHYNLGGFRSEYEDIEEFRKRLQCSEMGNDFGENDRNAIRLTERWFVEQYGMAYCNSEKLAIQAIVKAARTRWCRDCGKEEEKAYGQPLDDGLCDVCTEKKVAKQPLCPKCGVKIDHLVAPATVCERHVFLAGGEYRHEPGIDPEFPDIISYNCPQCHKVLFTDEDKANRFLLGQHQLT